MARTALAAPQSPTRGCNGDRSGRRGAWNGWELATVAVLADVTLQRARDATWLLAEREILRSHSPLRFVHSLVGAPVYRDILPSERSRQHCRVAALVAKRGAPRPEIAGHLLLAPPGDE